MIEKSRTNPASPLLVGVVDDDESMREALESLLKSVGFGTRIFESAEEFLKAGNCFKPDCLILDMRMPGLNGLELQQKLIEDDRPVPIVFISANCEADEKRKALSAGAIDFLHKPFTEDSLLGAVQAAIKTRAK
ncbi:MAG TPA: response regulator [Pyrinomonadaceae bacterium]